MSIPASVLVNITPSVISAGGNNLVLNGLFLTNNIRAPIGSVLSFANAAAVGAYFGLSSQEYTIAGTYFLGFATKTQTPSAILFAQYPSTAVAAYLRSAPVSGMTLAALQALSGVLIVTVNGTAQTSSTINLASAASFSGAAALITAGFTSPPFVVSYDSVSGAFVFTSSTTGTGSTVSYASGSLAAPLFLTQATAAVLSQGATQATPAVAMASIYALIQNFASFTTLFEPVVADKVSFAAFTNTAIGDDGANSLVYVCWDTDATAPTNTATASAGYLISQTNQYSGTIPVYAPVNGALMGAFICGAIASMDFTGINGRATLAYRYTTGLPADVTTTTAYTNLLANGYNAYCTFATAAQGFTMFQPGSISGPYQWADSFIGQIWLNNSIQLTIMTILRGANSLPFNNFGYGMLKGPLVAGPIAAGIRSGIIRTGVTLSATEVAQVNSQAGLPIDTTLSQQGYYLQINDQDPSTRAARKLTTPKLWYMDGQSIQSVSLASILVQ